MSQMKVVILCGGKGTRAYPFTEYYPKAMMPVNGTPIVVHLMHIYASQGLKSFVLAAGIVERCYPTTSQDAFPIGPSRSLIQVPTQIQVIAFSAARRIFRTFLATYGDGLGNLDLNELIAVHRRSGGLATLTTVPLRSQYGLVVYDSNGKVEHFIEKPLMDSHWINAGFMVFDLGHSSCGVATTLSRRYCPRLRAKGVSLCIGIQVSGSPWTQARISRNWKDWCRGRTRCGCPAQGSHRSQILTAPSTPRSLPLSER